MSCGIVIFAHNNRQIDYVKLAMVSGYLAKKNLQKPVSLVTDESTISWIKESGLQSKAETLFDQIITTDRPQTGNNRKFFDGTSQIVAPFINANRNTVWDLTPYEKTLLIDSDYFVLSDNLNNYWNVDCDVMISESYNDIFGDERTGYLDKFVSDTGVKMYWATTVMFTKNERSKLFFDLVEHVRKNYTRYADLYRFSDRMYRNDISFSVARHIMYGYQTDDDYKLPPVFSVIDRDILFDITEDHKFKILVSRFSNEDYAAVSISNKDIHVMNKESVIRNSSRILEAI